MLGQFAQAQKYTVTKSTVEYMGKKPTGFHNGAIPISKGHISVEDGQIKDATFVFDMRQITCWDIKKEESNQYFINHLKGADFFDVKKYPTAQFKITELQKTSEEKYTIKGNLTLKATTKPVTFKAGVKIEAGVITIKTDDYFYINRTHWGVKYKSKSFFSNLKDKFINDKVGVKIDITALK